VAAAAAVAAAQVQNEAAQCTAMHAAETEQCSSGDTFWGVLVEEARLQALLAAARVQWEARIRAKRAVMVDVAIVHDGVWTATAAARNPGGAVPPAEIQNVLIDALTAVQRL
jgi:hypothetical protein